MDGHVYSGLYSTLFVQFPTPVTLLPGNTYRLELKVTGAGNMSGYEWTVSANEDWALMEGGSPMYESTRMWTSPAQTIASSGTTVTASSSYFASGDVNSWIKAANQVRRITAYTSGTQVSIESPFSPDLAPGTPFQKVTPWLDTHTKRLFVGLLVSGVSGGGTAGGAYPFVM